MNLRDTDKPSVRILNGIGIAVSRIHQAPTAVGFHQHQASLCPSVYIHIEVIQPVHTGCKSLCPVPGDSKQRRQHEDEGQNMKTKPDAVSHGRPLICDKNSKYYTMKVWENAREKYFLTSPRNGFMLSADVHQNISRFIS